MVQIEFPAPPSQFLIDPKSILISTIALPSARDEKYCEDRIRAAPRKSYSSTVGSNPSTVYATLREKLNSGNPPPTTGIRYCSQETFF